MHRTGEPVGKTASVCTAKITASKEIIDGHPETAMESAPARTIIYRPILTPFDYIPASLFAGVRIATRGVSFFFSTLNC